MRKRIVVIIAVLAVAIMAAIVLARRAYVVPVLMYHSIDYDDKLTKLSVLPESFEKQMRFLHKNRYNIIGPDKLIGYMEGREPVPPRTAVITFDDGYHNNYEYAFPVLKRYKIPATIFVIVDKIGQPGYCTWEELSEMSDSGLVTIGSHTMSHKWLPSLDDGRLCEELKNSKDILGAKLGKAVNTLCYPMGAYDERVEDTAKLQGYRCAFATNPGRFKPVDDVFAVKRVRISRTSDNLFVFWIETSGYYTWIKEHRDE